MIKIWLDDERSAPRGYIPVNTVNNLKDLVQDAEKCGVREFFFSLDNDLGKFAVDGGDGRKFILWLIETGRNTPNYQIECHSMNPVAREYIEEMYRRYWKGV